MSRTIPAGEWTEVISESRGTYTLENDGAEQLYLDFGATAPRTPDTGITVKTNDQIPLDASTFKTAFVRPVGSNDGSIRIAQSAVRKLPQVETQVSGSSSTLPVDLAQQSGSDVNVDVTDTVDIGNRAGRSIGKARLMDASETLIDPVDAGKFGPYHDRVTSTATYATVNPGVYGNGVTVVADTSGSATLTVEVSNDGSTWDAYTVSIGGAEGAHEEVDGYRHVRAKVDQNLNGLQVGAKGL